MAKEQALFKTAYDQREHHYIPTGNGIENVYGYEINKTGQKVLVITGETDRYAKIQEQLPATLMENILKSIAEGDNSMFRPEGIYADTTEAPKNLIEARQMILSLENTWTGLTPEQRKAFDNDVERFVAESGNLEWFEKLGMIQKEPEATEAPSVPSEEKKGASEE